MIFKRTPIFGFRFWIWASEVPFFCTRKRPFSVILALPASYVFSNRLLFLICFSFSCFFLFLSSFLDARLRWLTSRLHFLIAFSLSHIPHSLFLCLLLIFFSFLEKTPPYEAEYDLFSKMYVFNFVVSFYADAILYPGVWSGRCIISQYQLWNWSLYHKFHRASFVYHNQLTPRSALHGTACCLFAIKI